MPTFLIVAALLAAAPEGGVYAVVQRPEGTVKASLFSDEYAGLAIAKVDDRVVTLRELTDALASAHVSHGNSAAARAGQAKKDYTAVLDRLIGTRLVVLEAHDMGLDEQPDLKAEMERYTTSALREGLKAKLTSTLTADPVEIESIYKEMIREWKVRSLLFGSGADAKAFAAAAKKKGWAKAKPKGAKGAEETQLVSAARHAMQGVLDALRGASVGTTAGPVPVEGGFAVFEVQAITYPEDPRKHAEAEQEARVRKQSVELKKIYSALVAKTAVIDQKTLDGLDLEAKKPGFKALLEDKRVLAKVQGAQDVTVADVAKSISEEFFHSMDRAIAQKKLNPRKLEAFNTLLYQRIFDAEARRQGIDKLPEFQRAVSDHHDAIVFGKFIEKVILPDLKITEGDAVKYYQAHTSELSFPAFYTLSSIGFSNQKAAQDAFDKLKGGTDFKWLKSNAQGLLPEEKRELDFDASTVSATMMPKSLAALLAGTKNGDVRVYAGEDGGHYLLSVKAVTPSKPQPYDEVREQVVRKVQQLRIRDSIDEWIAKLRKARKVQVYITQIVS